MSSYTFKVTGMKCSSCTSKIKGLKESVASIEAVEASLKDGVVQIKADASAMTLKKEIESLGFNVASFSKE